MDAAEARVVLRNGCWQNGLCLREVRVRAIAENDETLLEELSAAPHPLGRDTLLLERCVTGVGDAQTLQQFSLGDRETLLLCARRLTFGGHIDCVLSCPNCDERMDFRLQTDHLLLAAEADPPPLYFEETIIATAERYRVRLRLPCGADFEQTISQRGRTASQAVRALLARTVEWARKVEDDARMQTTIPPEQWPEELVTAISGRMGELDPQAEIALQLLCPVCQHQFNSAFDIGEYFYRELAAHEERRFREVHQLALAYHWSESEILNMSPRKRRHYLDLLAESSGE